MEEDSDPSWIVIDEAAGLGVALLPFAFAPSPAAAVFAFVLFRAFDAAKPPPVSHAERAPGAMGVLLDDLVAGALAALGVWLLTALLAAFALPA